ncbi:MAG: hypothetical protein ACTHN3_00965 [Solirubrobacterales bacterium]
MPPLAPLPLLERDLLELWDFAFALFGFAFAAFGFDRDLDLVDFDFADELALFEVELFLALVDLVLV